MVQSISHRVVGRMAAVLFVASGLVSVLSAFLPTQPDASRAGELVVGVVAIGVGGCAWIAPWQRWRRAASLWLVPIAFAILNATALTGSQDDRTFAVYFAVVFAWVGIGHPRWTALKLLPLGLLAYITPLVATGHSAAAVDSAFEVAVLCLLVGETLAWVSERLRVAEAVDERRVYEMQMLLRAAELLARENEPTRLPRVIAQLAVQLLRTEGALVLLVEDELTLRPVGAYLWPTEETKIALAPSSPLRRILVERRTASVEAAAVQAELGELPYRWVHVISLAGAGGQPVGLLVAGSGEEPPSVDAFTQDMALTFATQAGLALQRVRAVSALLEDSMRDELTGLGNRRFANLAMAGVEPGDALVVIDLDRFKALNDTSGHPAGDAMLRSVADHLRSALRGDDAAARLGGDEFLLVLRGARDNALSTVNRLERQWRASHPPVTYSAGVAVHVAGERPEETLARADAALYEAKQRGRACVRLASEAALVRG
ncbi:MAG TPA: sensor domain-containing diguanylate cyclase [Actinomycetota bacterium]|nr:sensor domain-containing diguanylate cyclase [Actinomycetota bacterium]